MEHLKQSPINRDDIHTVSLFLANKPGMLLRIALIFSRRGYNIESLVVSPALDGRYSRMTITARGDLHTLDQIIKQLNKLVDVLHASEHKNSNAVEKELALIKVKVKDNNRTEILLVVDHFKAQTVDLNHESLIIQVMGNTEKIDAILEMMGHDGIIEVVRTGKVVMARGVEPT